MSDLVKTKLPVVFILGPTASGKTSVGIELFQKIQCRLISVDSTLVYRGLDIGSAKPTTAELKKAPHRLIDICEPWDIYSAARFCVDAKKEIQRAHDENRVPVLIGGTMLYFKALEDGLADMPEANEAIRRAIEVRAAKEGWESLHRYLASVDPEAALRIHPNDPQRIQRALEVWEVSGITLTEWQSQSSSSGLTSKIIKCGLLPDDRSALHSRIEERFDTMLTSGFIEELNNLMQHPQIHDELPSMRSVGYRQGLAHLAGTLSMEDFRYKTIVATRQLAKRQMTWMRSMSGLQCYDSLSLNENMIVQQILKQLDKH